MSINSKLTIIATTLMSVLSVANVSAEEQPVAKNDDIEQITVTGIRGSVLKSLNVKRGSEGIVDAITSEELGKFPDQNVAESLQRITGVAITRSRGGDGQFVTVRGLGEEFNAVTFNNRLIATENAGREFSFDVIASELISEAQVFKSPTASQGDGSIGGRVNVNSAKPFDNPGLHFAGSIAGQYDEISEDTGPKLSAVLSNTWDDDKFGVLASFTFQERESRTDILESIGFSRFDVDANNSVDDPNDDVPVIAEDVRLTSVAGSVARQTRKRTGATLAFQYAVDDNSTLTFDTLYTKLESPSTVVGYSFFPSGTVTPGSIRLNDANPAQVIAHQTSPDFNDIVGRENVTDTDTIMVGANWEFDNGDNWKANIDLAWSKAEGTRDNVGSAGGSGSFFVLNYPVGQVDYENADGGVPNFDFRAQNGSGPLVPFSQLDAASARPSFARNTTAEVKDEILSFKGDFGYLLDSGEILFGFDYVDREKTSRVLENINQCAFCGSTETIQDRAPGLVGDFFTVFDDDFLRDASGNVPRAFPVFDLDSLRELFDIAAQEGVATAPDGVSSALTTEFNPAASNVLSETVTGAYVQLNADGELGNFTYNFNAGVRFAYTELESVGAGAEITSIELIDGNNQNIRTVTSDRSLSNNYFDVLPSFNLNIDLSDELLYRIAFSRSLARPTLTDLSTKFAVTSTNAGAEAIEAGNPGLEAVRSNNFDMSLEWYGEDDLSGSAAFFYKDISGFITNRNSIVPFTVNNVLDLRLAEGSQQVGPQDFNFFVSQPENGDSAEIYGLELAATKVFENGFGVSANLTLTESELISAGEKTDLENISDTSYNLAGFYENDGLQVQVSLNHRGDYLFSTAGEGALPEIVDDYTQIDASISYEINENITIFAEGINLTSEEFFRYSETKDIVETYEENGARYLVGLRGSF